MERRAAGGEARGVEAAWNECLAGNLPAVSLVLSALFAIFAVGHLLVFRPGLRVPMSLMAVASALLCAGVGLASRRKLPAGWSHRAAAALAGLGLLNSLVHLAVTGAPEEVSNVLLVLVGGGLLLYAWRWLALVTAVAWVGWAAVVAGWPRGQVHGAFALLSGTALGWTAWFLRVRAYERVYKLRRADESHVRELEGARALLVQRVHERTAELERANEWLRREIAERLRAEDQLRKAKEAAEEGDRRKAEFLNIASHELRNPLAPLRVSIQHAMRLAERGQAVPPQLFERMDRLSLRLTHMIGDLLDASRLEHGGLAVARSRMDLRGLVCEALETSRGQAPGREITLELPDDPLPVEADSGRIAQVLDNLLDNARKYSPSDQPIHVRLQSEHGFARVDVTDRGEGIPEDQQQRLFGRFARVQGAGAPKRSGLGLGLYICKQIVDLHGGRMVVESRPGQGSTFAFELPLAQRVEEDLRPKSEVCPEELPGWQG